MKNAMQMLGGLWKLAPDPDNKGREERWHASGPTMEAQDAPVPGIIQQVFPSYHGAVWYWHTFVPTLSAAPNERYLLRFGAVDYLADVWLNGTYVGGHEGGETPFTLDVTGALERVGENVLAVWVLNPTDEPIDGIRLVETPHRFKFVKDYTPGRLFNYGGIILPVKLLVVPAVRITDIFALPGAGSGRIRVAITVRSDESTPATGRLTASAGPSKTGEMLDIAALETEFASGETVHEITLAIAQPRLWSPDDPYLYRVAVTLEATRGEGSKFAHQQAVRCGFRDFRVDDGYFRLNGKRIFLRSTITCNHFPIGQVVPHNPDLLRRDLLYAKASGFNMVRFIAGVALPEQPDFCDEIGLMVYEESCASWKLGDSLKMAERYDRSVREMILRDRNHPSVTIWGMLNETRDGPVFRHAVEALSLVRSLDNTRLVLLSSGRWDCQPGIGSVSNPGSSEWEHVWGIEAPGAPTVSNAWDTVADGYLDRAGDTHVYPQVPHPPQTFTFLRTVGSVTKPVFLSEYGIGSLLNVIHGIRMYEQVNARPDLSDVTLFRSMADKLEADWQRFGFEGVYPFVEDMLRDSERLHVRQRLLGFDLIRSNPKICGFNLTGMLDHVITGEGLWTFWREWKADIADALTNGWAPLRWCLFGDPLHGYTGQTVKLEAVLANEDVLPPGEYPVCFRVSGPSGIVWERCTTARIYQPATSDEGPLAVPVLCEEGPLTGPAGVYVFAANMERGGAPAGGRLRFRLSDVVGLPRAKGTVTLWGIEENVEAWLISHGISCRWLGEPAPSTREVILVGDLSGAPEGVTRWRELARRMARGSTAIFLSPLAFKRGEDAVGWLPLTNKGRCYQFNNWLYHKEDVAKRHPIFDGLQAGGIMDWDYYGAVIPYYLFDG